VGAGTIAAAAGSAQAYNPHTDTTQLNTGRRESTQADREQAIRDLHAIEQADAQLGEPTPRFGDVGGIKGMKRPMLGTAAEYLRDADTPIGQYFESVPNVLESWAYGENADPLDLLTAPLEIFDPTALGAAAISAVNVKSKKRRKKKKRK
jgi:hypothetical protein